MKSQKISLPPVEGNSNSWGRGGPKGGNFQGVGGGFSKSFF